MIHFRHFLFLNFSLLRQTIATIDAYDLNHMNIGQIVFLCEDISRWNFSNLLRIVPRSISTRAENRVRMKKEGPGGL